MQIPRIFLFTHFVLGLALLGFGKPKEDTPFLEQTDARGGSLEQFIVQSMSQHFTMQGNEASFVLDYGGTTANPTIYEMKGFTMKPVIKPLSTADRMNGIDLKFQLSVSSTVYREGKMGTPPFQRMERWHTPKCKWRNGMV